MNDRTIVTKKRIRFTKKAENALMLAISEKSTQLAKERSKSVIVESIIYLSDGLKIHGILVRPNKKGKYPCIIYNRGGNREFGAINHHKIWTTLAIMAGWGYVVIASQYRGNNGSEGKEEFGGKDVNDVVILQNVLLSISTADTSRIGMYGWSRGGMMTFIALQKMRKIRCAVVGGPLVDLVAVAAYRPKMKRVFQELISKKGLVSELQRRSVMNWVENLPKTVPILLMHGCSDWRVHPEDSVKITQKFLEYHIPFRSILFEGADHGISEHEGEVMKQTKRWFKRYLKSSERLPNSEPHGA